MAIPSAVEKMNTEAAELEKILSGEIPDPSDTEVITDEQASDEVVPEIPVDEVVPKVTDDTKPADEVVPVKTEEVKPVEEVVKPKKEDSVDYWRQRFQVIEGKYNSEIQPLHLKVKELTEAMTKLSTKPDPIVSITETPEEIWLKETYPDVYKAMMISINKTSGHSNTIDPKITERLDRVERTTIDNAVSSFGNKLVTAVPDFEDVRDNPAFYTWLQESDDFTGYKKFELLQDASDKLDAPRVIKIYNAFKKTIETPQVETKPVVEDKGVKRDINKHIAPDTSTKVRNEQDNITMSPKNVEQLTNQIHKAIKEKDFVKVESLNKQLDEMMSRAFAPTP
jgi:hypothetical protein